jgi:hypothetical protein
MVGSSTAMGGPCAHKGTEGRNGGGGGEMEDAVGWCHGGPAPARWRGGKEETPWTGRELPARFPARWLLLPWSREEEGLWRLGKIEGWECKNASTW